MPSTFTPVLNLEKVGYDEQDETWGYTENDNWDKVDTAVGDLQTEVATVSTQAAPAGMLGYFARSTAPAGWIKARAGTIGSAASGGTVRANADTEALFTLWWSEFPALQLQTSAGVNVARGVSAAADYAADKRMPVFDERDQFSRGWKDDLGGGKSGGLLAVITDAVQLFTVKIPMYVGAGGATQALGQFNNRDGAPQYVDGQIAGVIGTGGPALRTGPETLPMNTAKLACWKL